MYLCLVLGLKSLKRLEVMKNLIITMVYRGCEVKILTQ